MELVIDATALFLGYRQAAATAAAAPAPTAVRSPGSDVTGRQPASAPPFAVAAAPPECSIRTTSISSTAAAPSSGAAAEPPAF